MQLTVQIQEETVADLESVQLDVSVKTGQALPDHPLELRLNDELLASARIASTPGNEGSLSIAVDPERCGEPCELQFFVSGPPAAVNVPVPIEVEGTVLLNIRKPPSFCPEPPIVRVWDANHEEPTNVR